MAGQTLCCYGWPLGAAHGTSALILSVPCLPYGPLRGPTENRIKATLSATYTVVAAQTHGRSWWPGPYRGARPFQLSSQWYSMLEFAVSGIWLTVVAPPLFEIKERAGNVTDPAQARCAGGAG